MSVLPHPGCSQEATLGLKLTLGPLGAIYEGERSALNGGSAPIPQSAPSLSVPLNILVCVSINKGRKPSLPPPCPGLSQGLGQVGPTWLGTPGKGTQLFGNTRSVTQLGLCSRWGPVSRLCPFPSSGRPSPAVRHWGTWDELARLQNRTHTTPFHVTCTDPLSSSSTLHVPGVGEGDLGHQLSG